MVQVPEKGLHPEISDACIQTDALQEQILCKNQSVMEGISPESNIISMNLECPIQKELLKRLHQLVEEDAHLQQQLHYVDQINLTLWKKLHNLEFHIGECKRKNLSEDCNSDSCIESEWEFSSRPASREQLRPDSSGNSKCQSPTSNRGILACLDQSEQEIKERLSKLENINASFEKELEARENLYLEKEKKYGEWMQTEQRFIGDLKRLTSERDELVSQILQLQEEKEKLALKVPELQSEMIVLKEKCEKDVACIKAEQKEIIAQLEEKVDGLLVKEKEYLKQITNLKLERNKCSDKLKVSYVQLQLELSKTRDEMRKKEDEFRLQLDDCKNKHMLEEARLVSELNTLQGKKLHCDEIIQNLQSRQNELLCMLRQKEEELEEARDAYKKNMEFIEEEHRALEAELRCQLRRMEEGTALATRVLSDERMRIEKELQENIEDLRGKEEVYKARISELENNVSHLHEELHRITGDLDSGFSSDGVSLFRREKLLNELRELRDRETELREKLDEMEQKEAAYRETLEHADRIVASVEQGYKNKIEELEISEKSLKQRVGHLEEVESRLRGALHQERRSLEGRKPDELFRELDEAEAREKALKEELRTLEQLQRSASNKVKELEKVRVKLETQLCDREEISSNLKETQQELEQARKSLAKMKKSENDLKSSLQQSESLFATTESQMLSKIRVMEDEKRSLEDTINELRAQVRDLERRVDEEGAVNIIKPFKNDDIEDIDYAEVDATYGTDSSFQLLHRPPRKGAASENGSQKPKATDTSESARQNLEDCMLRAMAAMTKDIQNKKSIRDRPTNGYQRPQQQAVSADPVAEENDYDEVLPRPTNFRVVQQVGSDTLLVGWDYVNPYVLEGYEVYLDGQLHETVYTPDRTKALIGGLNLRKRLQLGLCALSRYGQMSEPVTLQWELQSQAEGEEYSFCDDYGFEAKRPYSMEW